MADRHAQIPGGAYLNDVEEATLYQRQIPGYPYVNDTQQSAGSSGGGFDTLQRTTEAGGGRIGAQGGGLQGLQAIAASGGGTIRVNATGGGAQILQAVLAAGGGRVGLRGGGSETLQALTQSGGGTIEVSESIGGGAQTLQALTQLGGGRIGVRGGAFDLLQAIAESGGGRIGATGGGAQILQAIQSPGGGISEAPPIQPSAGFFGRAWWGYESFDGSNRPWWYRDLKDKAKELERQRQIRIDLGILSKPEEKQIAKVVREVETFVEEMPSPETAEQYIARAEMLSERIEKLVDDLQEHDDEQAITRMSKFFFERRTQCLM